MVARINNKSKWIFCHRGLWEKKEKQNSRSSILAATKNGFASEIDVRLASNLAYVGHEPKPWDPNYSFKNYDFRDSRLAINIKSDGLYLTIEDFNEFLTQSRSFVFDGSIPEMLNYKKLGFPHALRISEYEPDLPWNSEYVWVDAFWDDWWINNKFIEELLLKKQLVFVSPEIHKRPHERSWEWLLKKRSQGFNNISICTDFPLELSRLES